MGWLLLANSRIQSTVRPATFWTSWGSCMTSHSTGWLFPPEAANRAISRIDTIVSFGTGSGRVTPDRVPALQVKAEPVRGNRPLSRSLCLCVIPTFLHDCARTGKMLRTGRRRCTSPDFSLRISGSFSSSAASMIPIGQTSEQVPHREQDSESMVMVMINLPACITRIVYYTSHPPPHQECLHGAHPTLSIRSLLQASGALMPQHVSAETGIQHIPRISA